MKKNKRKILFFLISTLVVIIGIGAGLVIYPKNNSSNKHETKKKKVVVFFALNDDLAGDSNVRFISHDYKNYYISKEHPTVVKLQREGKLEYWRKKLTEGWRLVPDLILRYKVADEVDEAGASFKFSRDNHGLELEECEE